MAAVCHSAWELLGGPIRGRPVTYAARHAVARSLERLGLTSAGLFGSFAQRMLWWIVAAAMQGGFGDELLVPVGGRGMARCSFDADEGALRVDTVVAVRPRSRKEATRAEIVALLASGTPRTVLRAGDDATACEWIARSNAARAAKETT
ncbi:hypothetical protein [Amaricoccus sp.]|uniref:hypothetical protein n=1 Tax=Amaricoccus sp. TaxID=1872485 RepID=UPI001B507BC1|nr:hypothetical protein [Amaricoccus sp.]MBP7002284.1 hypothetical protein [Amaricoccus sp.]